MKSTWILVADNSRARIFTADTQSSPLVELETLAHPEGREQQQAMTSDISGRDTNRNGAGSHAYQTETEPKKHEAIEFAKRVAQHLEKARGAIEFRQLIIVAAPAFLGILRSELNEQLKKQVCLELDKNLSQQSPEDIRKHMPKYLPCH